MTQLKKMVPLPLDFLDRNISRILQSVTLHPIFLYQCSLFRTLLRLIAQIIALSTFGVE